MWLSAEVGKAEKEFIIFWFLILNRTRVVGDGSWERVRGFKGSRVQVKESGAGSRESGNVASFPYIGKTEMEF